MTLESRLVSYDWDNQFQTFQDATVRGSFIPLCRTSQSTLLPVSFKFIFEFTRDAPNHRYGFGILPLRHLFFSKVSIILVLRLILYIQRKVLENRMIELMIRISDDFSQLTSILG